MTKKEMVEHFKQNMLEFKGNEEEVEIKTALYIYIQLGKIKSFDEKYYFGNEQTKRNIYKMAKRTSNSIEKVAENKKIICVTLSYLYCSILKEFDIDATTSQPDEDDWHIYPIIITKSKQCIKADLQVDLENIQTKSRLQNFEYWGDMKRNRYASCNQKKLTQMLIEAGYIKDEKDYKDEEIKKLEEQIIGKRPNDVLDILLKNDKLYDGNSSMGIIEINIIGGF